MRSGKQTRQYLVRGFIKKAVLSTATLFAVISAHAQQSNPCIGATGPLTGAAAFGAEAVEMGAEIALDEINAKGGVLGQKLNLQFYDDGGQPPKGAGNVSRIALADKCVVILGGYHTGVQLAMRDPIAQVGIPYVGTTAAGTGIIEHENGQNKWMFRVSLKDKWIAQTLVAQAILLVEQLATKATAVADRVYVMENGAITISGISQDLAHDPRGMEAYLGKKAQ